MKAFVAQRSAPRHCAVANALDMRGPVYRFITDLRVDYPLWPWVKELVPAWLPPAQRVRLVGRCDYGVSLERIQNLTGLAFSPQWKRGQSGAATEFSARRDAVFCRAVAAQGFSSANTAYAYNDAALELFQAARE